MFARTVVGLWRLNASGLPVLDVVDVKVLTPVARALRVGLVATRAAGVPVNVSTVGLLWTRTRSA